MKNNLLGILLLFGFLGFFQNLSYSQGVTSSGINGRVVDNKGIGLPGATVIALHQPTGTKNGTTTDTKGFYRFPNISVGGPYVFTITYIGYQKYEQTGIYLSLGQTLKIDVELKESTETLQSVEIVAVRNDLFDGNRTGTTTNINRDAIDKMPSIARNITDFTRLTPQARVSNDGSIEIAGMNNRYNAIFIDGAVNNDVYGLAATGTNGGQTGISPFSPDIIDQFTVNVAPYDVKLGGFAGAGINAVTRRGTNNFEASVYYFFRNQSIAGKTPTNREDMPDSLRKRLPNFSSQTYGARVGGAIIKDKLFYFMNVEFQNDQTPRPFDFGTYVGKATRSDLNNIANKLNNQYGYDPGSYEGANQTLDGQKVFARIDWNISSKHSLTARYQYTKGRSITPGVPTSTGLTFSNAGIDFPSITNTAAVELKSVFGNKYSNDLIVGLTFVRDNRNPMGGNFPSVSIKDGNALISFGSEQFSTANRLFQDIYTLTDNFEIYLGKHTLTVGTHNELYNMYNLFIRQNFGYYQFNSINDFLNNDTVSATQYDRTYSLVDGVTGPGSKAAAKFKALQLGFYVQDEYQITSRFKVSLGLALDIPMFLTSAATNSDFNTRIIPQFQNIETGDGKTFDGKTGQMPKAQFLLSPRIGFNWDLFDNQKTQVRGGIGIFTSRIPYVWPGACYTNNGITMGGMRTIYDPTKPGTFIQFNPDWNNQPGYKPGDPIIPSGEVDIFAKNFKYPQVWRTSLGIDQKLPWGLVITGEFTYTKNMNNVMYYNYRYMKNGQTLTGTGDNRPLWKINDSIAKTKYTDVIYGYNTNQGWAYDLTFQLQKQLDHGFSGNIAYTLGHAKSMNDANSSQNSSQWRVVNVRGKNDLDLSWSDYDLGSRVMAYFSYKIEYAKHFATTVGLYYNGQSGRRFSYGFSNSYKDPVTKKTYNLGEDTQNLELMYVPSNQNDIRLVDILDKNGNVVVSKQTQWENLNAFIEGDPYLSTRRGQYTERNGSRTPFESTVDLHLAQDFYLTVKGKRHTLQVTFDIFNFMNFLNPGWGRKYYVAGYYGNYPLLQFQGFEKDEQGKVTTVPQYSFTPPKSGNVWSLYDSGLSSSRWQAQIGFRYLFR
ncbi:MAG: TonB-dependent receptor [Bacteroidales bacterium]|jgi:hypothetical protein|nr:TonB-dependent receptor [Bacteroidales bacterium]